MNITTQLYRDVMKHEDATHIIMNEEFLEALKDELRQNNASVPRTDEMKVDLFYNIPIIPTKTIGVAQGYIVVREVARWHE